MHKLDIGLDKILWDFGMQKDDSIPTRRPAKEKIMCHLVDFAIPADQK